jgi:hypothetical protein
MSKQIEAIKLALEAADELQYMLEDGYKRGSEGPPRVHRLVSKIRALAEQPAPVQPCPHNHTIGDGSPENTFCYDCKTFINRTELAEQPAQQEPVAFITPLMEQQMFDDWCPYKGNPDPRVVWAAAVEAVNGLLLGAAQQPPAQHEPQSMALNAAMGYIKRHTPKLVHDEICKALRRPVTGASPQPAQRKPLTPEQVKKAMMDAKLHYCGEADLLLTKAIEAAHNIKENT